MPSIFRSYSNYHYTTYMGLQRLIVESIGLYYYLLQGKLLLRGNQRWVLSGCFSRTNDNDTLIISSNDRVPELTTQYHTDLEEADSRLWRHACQSCATRILILLSNTNIYDIALNSTDKKFKCHSH